MRALSSIGVELVVVSSLLLLGLTVKLYYIFVQKPLASKCSSDVAVG